MSVNDLKINQIALDNKNRVWTVGQDVSVYDGSNWIYLNYLNSALPSVTKGPEYIALSSSCCFKGTPAIFTV